MSKMSMTLTGRKPWLFILLMVSVLAIWSFTRSGLLGRPLGRGSAEYSKSRTYWKNVVPLSDSESSIGKAIEDIHEKLFQKLKPQDEKCMKRFPACIIIGVNKCGTRELTEFLHLHPQIEIYQNQSAREMPYFSNNYFKGEEWFRNQMPCSFKNQITIMKNSVYFPKDDLVPARIQKFNSSIKLILLVREPASRTVSQYMHRIQRKLINARTPLEENIFSKKGINEDVNIIKNSVYDKPMKQWLKYFNLDQFLIIDANEMKYNLANVLQRVEDFLGLAHYIKPEMLVWNKEKGYYCVSSNLTGTGMVCYSSARGKSLMTVNPQTLTTLKEYFQEKNKHFFDIIGQSFQWH